MLRRLLAAVWGSVQRLFLLLKFLKGRSEFYGDRTRNHRSGMDSHSSPRTICHKIPPMDGSCASAIALSMQPPLRTSGHNPFCTEKTQGIPNQPDSTLSKKSPQGSLDPYTFSVTNASHSSVDLGMSHIDEYPLDVLSYSSRHSAVIPASPKGTTPGPRSSIINEEPHHDLHGMDGLSHLAAQSDFLPNLAAPAGETAQFPVSRHPFSSSDRGVYPTFPSWIPRYDRNITMCVPI